MASREQLHMKSWFTEPCATQAAIGPRSFASSFAHNLETRHFARAAVMMLAMLAVAVGVASAQNPIVVENQQPGTGAWLITGNTGSDATGQIRAYMSAPSVNK